MFLATTIRVFHSNLQPNVTYEKSGQRILRRPLLQVSNDIYYLGRTEHRKGPIKLVKVLSKYLTQ